MEIRTSFEYEGKIYDAVYREEDPEANAQGRTFDGVHAYCFCGGKFLLVYNAGTDRWTPPGGAIEPGETWREAVVREVKEESNMKVLRIEWIGYQDVLDGEKTVRQVKAFCEVEPFGEFVSDPDGDITAVRLVSLEELSERFNAEGYFNRDRINSRVMERAFELNSEATRDGSA